MPRRNVENNAINKSKYHKRKKLNSSWRLEVNEIEDDSEQEESDFEDSNAADTTISAQELIESCVSSEEDDEELEGDDDADDDDEEEEGEEEDEEDEEDDNKEEDDEGYDDRAEHTKMFVETSDERETSDQEDNISNNINSTNSPKPEFRLTTKLVNDSILTDLSKKQWKIGKPVGKGSFGEIFLVSDNINGPVTNDNAKFVAKLEPHSNGPLFVEIHCLINTSKFKDENSKPIPGIPQYIASGSHYFKKNRYRFLILPRFDRDLHSFIKNCQVDPKSILVLAVQILDILEHLHDKGYCHSDIKAENLMIGKWNNDQEEIKTENKTENKIENKTEIRHKVLKGRRAGRKHKRNCSSNNSDISVKFELDSEYDLSNQEDNNYEDEDDYDDYSIFGSNNRCTRKRTSKMQFNESNTVRLTRAHHSENQSNCNDTIKHNLRPSKKINYSEYDENSKSSYNDDDIRTIDEYITKHRNLNNRSNINKSNNTGINLKKENNVMTTEDRIFLIDYGLALKLIDSNGVHRPFCMDQRRAHDGTLEFTSRDAHMGAHSRRSDLECLGYNLIYWSQGYLPWKEKAEAQQQDRVHGMKEYLMTDVREMLKHIYGKQVPKYLGEYMHLINNLAYDERPQYEKLKEIFQLEFQSLGGSLNNMKLKVDQLIKNSVKIKKDTGKNRSEMKNGKNIMKSLGILTPPFQIIGTGVNSNSRVSPKNLRSKRNSAAGKSEKSTFCWAEVLSQDPDQIARKRAEKEFEREQNVETPINKYNGKPTYAILEIQKKMKFKDRLENLQNYENDVDEIHLQGYTKPMMDILRKKQASLFADCKKTTPPVNQIHCSRQHSQIQTSIIDTPPSSKKCTKRLNHPIQQSLKRNKQQRTKNTATTNISQSLECENNSDRRFKNRISSTAAKKLSKSLEQNSRCEFNSTDESSTDSVGSSNATAKNSICSKSNSLSSSSMPKRVRKQNRRYLDGFVTITQSAGNVSENSNCSSNSQTSVGSTTAVAQSYPGSLSDEDTRDMFDNNTITPKRKRGRQPLNKLKIKINGTATIVKKVIPVQNLPVNRRKGIPRKRNAKGELLRCV